MANATMCSPPSKLNRWRTATCSGLTSSSTSQVLGGHSRLVRETITKLFRTDILVRMTIYSDLIQIWEGITEQVSSLLRCPVEWSLG